MNDRTDDDELWVDSTDRKVALRALTEHRDEQHLTTPEFDRRTELVRGARNRADLRRVFADLPPPHPQLDGDEGTNVPLVPGGVPQFQRYQQGPTTRGERVVLLGTGGVIVAVAVVAGWWITAAVLACFVVLVTLLRR